MIVRCECIRISSIIRSKFDIFAKGSVETSAQKTIGMVSEPPAAASPRLITIVKARPEVLPEYDPNADIHIEFFNTSIYGLSGANEPCIPGYELIARTDAHFMFTKSDIDPYRGVSKILVTGEVIERLLEVVTQDLGMAEFGRLI